MKRREFVKTSLAAAALAGLNQTVSNAKADDTALGSTQEFYELRMYRLKDAANQKLLDGYLERAAIPALNRLGAKPVGAFTEIEAKGGPAVFVLIPHSSPSAFASAAARLPLEEEYLKAGADYLGVGKGDPAFDRIDSWLLLAFSGMPKLTARLLQREKAPRFRNAHLRKL